jgi:hypothetical protein
MRDYQTQQSGARLRGLFGVMSKKEAYENALGAFKAYKKGIITIDEYNNLIKDIEEAISPEDFIEVMCSSHGKTE